MARCEIRSTHLPVVHVLERHFIVPEEWQVRLYDEVKLDEWVDLCPTHHAHTHIATEAMVGQMCLGRMSIFDRRQFGREIWNWAEDAALWLKPYLVADPEFNWKL